MKRNKRKKVLVIYHDKCTDGFTSAWVAWTKFGNKADYVGSMHYNTYDDVDGKDVYMVDISYEEYGLKKIKEKANKLIIIDHHISVKDVANKFADEFIFNEKKSGAFLAWKYFYPKKKIPKLIEYVQDRDLFKWKVSKSKEMCLVLDSFPFDFKIWDKLSKEFDSKKKNEEYYKKGKLLVNYQNNLINRALNTASKVIFEDHEALIVNSPLLESDIGNNLLNMGVNIGIIWYETEYGIKVSLRSNKKVDVSILAKKYGGGGHKMSSGFFIKNKNNIPWKYVR